MASNPEHFGLTVKAMHVHIECGDHGFFWDGQEEGPVVCPICGRQFTWQWSANIWPKEQEPQE